MAIDTQVPRPTARTHTHRHPVAAPTPERRPWADHMRRAELRAATWLAAHSVTALRLSLGLVFLGFGLLKFVPGASPAEALVMRTVDTLTLGLVTGPAAVAGTAVVETFIGVTLVTGFWLRAGLLALAGSLIGIMSPVVLFFPDLFPGFAPTLEAQYVLKDIVLVTSAAVVAARALGVRLVAPPTTAHR
jgi:putative oxidoreductase